LPQGVRVSRADTRQEWTETGERRGCGGYLCHLITIILNTATDNQGWSSCFTQSGCKPKTWSNGTTDLPVMQLERQTSLRTWYLTPPKLILTPPLESYLSYEACLEARQMLLSVESICCWLSLRWNRGGKLQLVLLWAKKRTSVAAASQMNPEPKLHQHAFSSPKRQHQSAVITAFTDVCHLPLSNSFSSYP